tara:strand:+ start:1099 stop:1239 length:141 start_codon:yes stop_codon:yes gene_type:complete
MLMRKTKKHSGLSKGEKKEAITMAAIDIAFLSSAVAILWFFFIVLF